MADKNFSTGKKLTASVLIAVVLTICLCVTTYALVYSVSVKNNIFHTGTVDINLNDGKPVISEHEFLFEPGMTVVKDFFIENESTWEVYYKLYFADVSGDLADVLDITISKGADVLYEGKLSKLTRLRVDTADDTLQVGERRDLTIAFHFPEEAGNDTQNLQLSFSMCADAVQTKNNPGKLFE